MDEDVRCHEQDKGTPNNRRQRTASPPLLPGVPSLPGLMAGFAPLL
jgi:hypothetical protein